MKTAEVFCKNYAIEKKFVAFVVDCNNSKAYLIFVIFFTQAKFLENKI